MKKTSLICISAARSFKPRSYINLNDDVTLSGKSLKLLGYHFDSNPGPEAHIRAVLKKVRYRTWMIFNVKRLGMCPAGLINIYVTTVSYTHLTLPTIYSV